MRKPAGAKPVAMVNPRAMKRLSEREELEGWAKAINALRRSAGLDEIPVEEQIAQYYAEMAKRQESR